MFNPCEKITQEAGKEQARNWVYSGVFIVDYISISKFLF